MGGDEFVVVFRDNVLKSYDRGLRCGAKRIN